MSGLTATGGGGGGAGTGRAAGSTARAGATPGNQLSSRPSGPVAGFPRPSSASGKNCHAEAPARRSGMPLPAPPAPRTSSTQLAFGSKVAGGTRLLRSAATTPIDITTPRMPQMDFLIALPFASLLENRLHARVELPHHELPVVPLRETSRGTPIATAGRGVRPSSTVSGERTDERDFLEE
jgi:hypothetical protein